MELDEFVTNKMSDLAASLVGVKLVVPVFTAVDIDIPGVRAEYCHSPERLQFHFFCDGPFPEGFGPALQKMAETVGHRGPRPIVCDYTPEVKSWYFEFCPTAATGPGGVARLFMRRLAGLVIDGEGSKK